MITESSGSPEEKSYNNSSGTENGNHNSATGGGAGSSRNGADSGSGSGPIRHLQSRLQAKASNSSVVPGSNFGKAESATTSVKSSPSKRGREAKAETSRSSASSLHSNAAAGAANGEPHSSQRSRDKASSSGNDDKDNVCAKSFKSSSGASSSAISSQQQQRSDTHTFNQSLSINNALSSLSNQPQRLRSNVPASTASSSAAASTTSSSQQSSHSSQNNEVNPKNAANNTLSGFSGVSNRHVNNGTTTTGHTSRSSVTPLLSTGLEANSNSFLTQHISDNASDSKELGVSRSSSSASFVPTTTLRSFGAKEETNGGGSSSSETKTSSDALISKTVPDSAISTPVDSSGVKALCSTPTDEFEEVVIPVAGKKEPIKGRVWKDEEGNYCKYLCFNDGIEYKPGGKLIQFFFYKFLLFPFCALLCLQNPFFYVCCVHKCD